MCAVCFVLPLIPVLAGSVTIVDTKHNLSVTGPGDIKALTETRVCIFCHTPHNATPRTPLWNKEVGSQTYTLYTSTTINAAPEQPKGPSRLCLSCHDGTIAIGTVLQPAGGISVTHEITPGGPSNIGGANDLSGDHPFSFSYDTAAASNSEIVSVPYATPPHAAQCTSPSVMLYSVAGVRDVECPTCHDAHIDCFRSPDKLGTLTGKFLRVNLEYSDLCLQCHDLTGWIGSSHQTSTALIDSNLFPVAPRTWPTWDTIDKWGCMICHTSHNSPSGPNLLLFSTVDEVCFQCHGSTPPGNPHTAAAASAVSAASVSARSGAKNIAAAMERMSSHGTSASPAISNPRASSLALGGQTVPRDVTCSDCHNPHEMGGRSGSSHREGMVGKGLTGVSGIDKNGTAVSVSTYEYEVCFKCHSDYSGLTPFVPRVIDTVNTRQEFDALNSSFHPVEQRGKNPNVPSLPSSTEPTLTASSIIYCTDCHSDDTGTKGPHGSSFPPILVDQYETADNTPESYQNYALCYRCHSRTSILSDVSFQKKALKTTATGGGHSGHLANGAPCSACHDAHGVNVTSPFPPAGTGDHTHLINFDTRIVSPTEGNGYPFFAQRGVFSGSCTLVCHGKVHDNLSYP
jgi:predicted CXXCH cytochrome family protein